MDITQVIGTIGAATVLLGFMMLHYKKWDVESTAYLLSNIIGSMILIIYAVILKSYPFILLNTIWVIVALTGLISKKSKAD